LTAGERQTCVQEWRLFVEGITDGLDAFQLDPPANCYHADNKLRQHVVAVECGLSIPKTMVTNDPRTVRAFARSTKGGVVCKMIHRALLGERRGVPTTTMSASDLRNLDGLPLCPMIFQQRVPKALELRVTIVGRQIFSAATDSQKHDGTRDDWRVDQEKLVWRPYKLPKPVESALLRFMDHFGLNYGAADFILTPDGRYVFLEVNCRGVYGWIENETGLPISRAIADLLAGRTAPRVAAPHKRRSPRRRPRTSP
jgi:glutathione synthase/RimK-type ligase-like ATP-grasp enzyme